MFRLRQFPEPQAGTWQYDLFEKVFGYEYDLYKSNYESEEKITKYNYAEHLHPSIIKKFDVNSEDFQMYIKKLNYETVTLKEQCKNLREYYCKNILPLINLCPTEKLGSDITHYVINTKSNQTYENYLYENYSNQKEEFLFRQVEEANFLNKNKPLVNRFMYTNIKKEKIGLRASELTEIINNPIKFKNMRKALELKFEHYEPVSYLDNLKFSARKAGYLDTMIEHEVDVRDENFKPMDLFVLQYGFEPPADDAPARVDNQQFKEKFDRIDYLNYFNYNGSIDWSDYESDFPTTGLMSPKKNRLEVFNKRIQAAQDMFMKKPKKSSEEAGEGEGEEEEEVEERPVDNIEKYLAKENPTDSEKDIVRFLEDTTEKDLFATSEDMTEEELEIASANSPFKPTVQTEEYKSTNFFYFVNFFNFVNIFIELI